MFLQVCLKDVCNMNVIEINLQIEKKLHIWWIMDYAKWLDSSMVTAKASQAANKDKSLK